MMENPEKPQEPVADKKDDKIDGKKDIGYFESEPEAPPVLPDLTGDRPLWKRIAFVFAANLTAFIASFCIMVLELVASRVISRHLGNSLFTWTSVIGIVLAGITIGNLVGGRLADRFRPASVLSVLFFLAAAACATIPLVNDWAASWAGWSAGPEKASGIVVVLYWITGATEHLPWSARVFGHVLVVFLLPSTLLGTIGPAVAKMALDQGLRVGKTVGNVYAWGALGSIAGTFMTGFYLISRMGTQPVILSVGGVLGIVGVIYSLTMLRSWSSTGPLCLIAPILAIAVPGAAYLNYFEKNDWSWPFETVERDGRMVLREKPDKNELYIEESDYTYMRIDKQVETEEGKDVETRRDLVMDSLIHAELKMEDPTDLQYEYENIYQAVTHKFVPEDAGEEGKLACLFLGGGGYVYPRYIKATWPGAYIEVAEIDPAVTAADVAAFGLAEEEIQVVNSPADRKRQGNPIWIYHLDARNHVDDLIRRMDAGEEVQKFDFIFGDAFNFLGVPFHLTTKEFNGKLARLLKPGSGIYMINVIDIFKSGKFVGAIYNTFREAFGENVYVFCTNENEPDMRENGRDTFIVIGALRPLDLSDLPGEEHPFTFTGSLLQPKHLEDLETNSGRMVLTDDWAPVENLLEYVVNRWKS